MVTLGMSAHTDRLLRLMVENGVTNTAVLERLNAERCMEINLPWALVDAAQRRWVNEKMNMGQELQAKRLVFRRVSKGFDSCLGLQRCVSSMRKGLEGPGRDVFSSTFF